MKLMVNGVEREVDGAEPWESLLFVLRERLGIYGSKNACEQGECGSCTVFLDGKIACSCLVAATQAQGREVVTIEGLGDDDVAHAVRDAMQELGAVQCGFCTPGFVVAMTSTLRDNLHADGDEIAESLAGNLCRCTGYRKILAAAALAQDTLTTNASHQ